jgi:hypothetical protein
MGQFAVKSMFVFLLLCFGVFFGVETVTKGIERINGPLPPQAVQPQLPKQEAEQPKKEQPAVQQTVIPTDERIIARPPSDGFLHHLAVKTGDLLQILTQKGIESIVMIFDAVFH